MKSIKKLIRKSTRFVGENIFMSWLWNFYNMTEWSAVDIILLIPSTIFALIFALVYYFVMYPFWIIKGLITPQKRV